MRLKRIIVWLVVIGIVGVGAAAVGMRMIGSDTALWHVDPATAERTGSPNDYLVASDGTTAAETDVTGPVLGIPPKEHLFLFDSVARNSDRVTVLAGSVDDLHITYVQRSLVIGFPDYITVKAIPVGDGSALIIYSRSRYGYSDMGVNKDRIDQWLAQMSPLS